MKNRLKAIAVVIGSLLCGFVLTTTTPKLTAQTSQPTAPITIASLVGIWTLTAADNLKPDGTRVHDYGPNPQGVLVFGADGRYTVQIVRADRMKFASGDKFHGTADEYKDASTGMSCHFGRYTVDAAKGTITFQVERASFPNWEGATQTRPFTLVGDELSWRVPARPDGSVPISVWRRDR